MLNGTVPADLVINSISLHSAPLMLTCCMASMIWQKEYGNSIRSIHCPSINQVYAFFKCIVSGTPLSSPVFVLKWWFTFKCDKRCFCLKLLTMKRTRAGFLSHSISEKKMSVNARVVCARRCWLKRSLFVPVAVNGVVTVWAVRSVVMDWFLALPLFFNLRPSYHSEFTTIYFLQITSTE